MSLSPKEMTLLAAKYAADKKAEELLILEVGKVSLVADYFIICSGTSKIQVQAICDHLSQKMKEIDVELLHKEGYNEGRWVLLDYGSVVVHVFQREDREFYNLERLWAEAPVLPFTPAMVERGEQ